DGEAVLVTQGSVAASYFPEKSAPIDALIVGSIDEQTSKRK
ncbi:MAG: ethanolamine utilization protein EutN, partial [Mesorhizobium sp.]